jgi:hypothetical protein
LVRPLNAERSGQLALRYGYVSILDFFNLNPRVWVVYFIFLPD